MQTSAIAVHEMLSVLSVEEIEKRIGEVPGVKSVTVNFAAGNATVRYDKTQLEATDIKSAVRQRGFEPADAAGGSAVKLNEAKATETAPPMLAPAAAPPASHDGAAPAKPTEASATDAAAKPLLPAQDVKPAEATK